MAVIDLTHADTSCVRTRRWLPRPQVGAPILSGIRLRAWRRFGAAAAVLMLLSGWVESLHESQHVYDVTYGWLGLGVYLGISTAAQLLSVLPTVRFGGARPAKALLLAPMIVLTACSSSSVAPQPIESSTTEAVAATPTPTCTDPGQDVIVRIVAPGVEPTAQRLGYYCGTTEQQVATTSPTGVGFCTQVALASDNPGYDADATPAPPLKGVTTSVGGSCD